MKLVLHVWRQKSRDAAGAFARYEAPDVSPDMSFLELLDVINERLMTSGEQPIAFNAAEMALHPSVLPSDQRCAFAAFAQTGADRSQIGFGSFGFLQHASQVAGDHNVAAESSME